MRVFALVGSLTVLFLLAGPVLVSRAAADDAATCENASGDEAIAACARTIQSHETSAKSRADAYNSRGYDYRVKGDLDHAIADYTEAIRLDPTFVLAYKNRGVAFEAKGDLDRSIADFTEAIRLDPTFALAYNNRGIVYKAKGDYGRAIADYTEAIRINPLPSSTTHNVTTQINVYNNRGLAYGANGDQDRAIADYTEAIRLDPTFVLGYRNRASAFLNKGDLDRAIADYTEVIRLDPNKGGVIGGGFLARGNAYYAKQDYDHAISDYTEQIRLYPNSPDIYHDRGLAYFYGGILAKALADFSLVSEHLPNDAYSAIWVDIAGQRNNIPSRLSQVISKIDMKAWPAPVIRMFLGQMTTAAVLAAAEDSDATKKKGKICEANFYTGELALRQSKKDDAIRLFRLAASDCPQDFDERDAAKAELRLLGAAP
jgi:tetratricopeptide (TPR) repeat protein